MMRVWWQPICPTQCADCKHAMLRCYCVGEALWPLLSDGGLMWDTGCAIPLQYRICIARYLGSASGPWDYWNAVFAFVSTSICNDVGVILCIRDYRNAAFALVFTSICNDVGVISCHPGLLECSVCIVFY